MSGDIPKPVHPYRLHRLLVEYHKHVSTKPEWDEFAGLTEKAARELLEDLDCESIAIELMNTVDPEKLETEEVNLMVFCAKTAIMFVRRLIEIITDLRMALFLMERKARWYLGRYRGIRRREKQPK